MSPEDPLAVHTAAFAAWLATEKNYSPHTVSAYSSDLAAFFTFCRQSGGDAGTAPCVRAFAASLYGRNSARSMARKLSALRSFFRYLQKNGLFTGDPLTGLSGPRLERRLPGFLTVDEVFALLEAPGPEDSSFPRDRAIMEMLYATGMRVSELTGSNLPDYDLAAEMVLVRGKGNKERLAPFGSAAKEALLHYLPERAQILAGTAGTAAEALFVGSRGTTQQPQCGTPAGPLRPEGRHCRDRNAPRAPPLLCHPSAGNGRRPAHRAGTAGPRQPVHHPAVHPRGSGPPDQGLRRGPSPGAKEQGPLGRSIAVFPLPCLTARGAVLNLGRALSSIQPQNIMQQVRSTTILAVRHRGQVAVAGDGQVTLGNTIVKHQAKKVRRLYKDRVITGFAGATADAFTLYDRLEQKLEQFNGSLLRAATELARDWRTDKMLRRLEAMLIAVDAKYSLLLSGNGDVIEADDGILAIGSGGPYALAAARALIAHSDLDAEGIARESLAIAGNICIYTNSAIVVEVI